MAKMNKQRYRRELALTMVSYMLAIMTMNGMDRGMWRHVVMGVAAAVLVVALSMFAWSRWYGGCERDLSAGS